MDTHDRIAKRVKFDLNAKDNATFTPLAKPHPSALRKLWLKRCAKGEFDELKKEMDYYKARGLTIERFFSREGRVILNWLLCMLPTAESFNFACSVIPNDLIKPILSEDDYSLVNKFLKAETSIEEYGKIDERALKGRADKLKLLLSLESNDIKGLLSRVLSKKGLSEGVKSSVQQALNEIAQNNKPGTSYIQVLK